MSPFQDLEFLPQKLNFKKTSNLSSLSNSSTPKNKNQPRRNKHETQKHHPCGIVKAAITPDNYRQAFRFKPKEVTAALAVVIQSTFL